MLGRHADLFEIHRELTAIFAVDEDTGRHWAAAEEDLERRLSVAVPGAGKMIDQARARGDRVIFVSDTHTPKASWPSRSWPREPAQSQTTG